jgi:hypothetical protein
VQRAAGVLSGALPGYTVLSRFWAPETEVRLSQNFSFWESNFEIHSFVRLKA